MKKEFWIPFVVMVVLILCFVVISLIPPQSHKYVYVWQCYIIQRGAVCSDLCDVPFHTPSLLRKIPPPIGYTGRWKIWDDMGRIVTDTEYLNGQMHGLKYWYFRPSEQLGTVVLYRHGYEVNQIAQYDESGQKLFSRSYDMDTFLPDGDWVYFASTGTAYHTSHYEQGVLQGVPFWDDVPPPGFSGIWVTYSQDGAIAEKSIFKNGSEVICVSFSKNNSVSSITIKREEYKYYKCFSLDSIEMIYELDSNGCIVDGNHDLSDGYDCIGSDLYDKARRQILESVKQMELSELGVHLVKSEGDLMIQPIDTH